ncbi:MalY/PatB family protein [Sulfoacidibacillus thermotolerans]|uniref:cysteine-S-conjugate beta-lyase n=1 Tax=Sulfoacidibacillus thermotolerans TaxID=1765684 RepID=A0A2U3CYR8_SULT2|nr:MalY/PatB family protein [Sulfoacidibacillus thermotolerans]PWI54172.1 cystathionine beta-lyase [Sulfoacidibacillus thermotolerans]
MNFDEIVERIHTGSLKWDGLEALFGEKNLLPLWVADMDFRAPEEVISALHTRVEHGVFGYQAPQEELDQAIIDWWNTRHHFAIERDWLVHCPGVVPSLSLSVQTFTDPNDSIVIQPPVYPPFFKVIKENGRLAVNNPLQLIEGQYKMDFDHLAQQFEKGAKMLILCNPHNPVGRVFNREELDTLGKLCEHYGVTVLSDEIHGDLVYPPHVHTPFASVREEFLSFSITFAAPSKTFNIAGLHASYAIIPNPTLRKTFIKALDRLGLRMQNVLSSAAMQAAYRFGAPWLNELLVYLQDNLIFLQHELQSRLPEITMQIPQGTYLAWLDCRKLGLSTDELSTFMVRQAGLALNSGAAFGIEGEGFMRLNIACPRSTLQRAIDQLEHAVKQIRTN